MRHTVSLSAIGLAALLTGCGGGGGGSGSSASTTPTYNIGGNVSGLSGVIVLQNDAGNNLTVSSNGAFTFSDPLQAGVIYDVTVATQPTGQVCSVSSGSGTVSAAVTNVVVACTAGSAITGEWTWRTGSGAANAAGIYGTQGTAAAANTPGARVVPASWTDASGNFWLFGGYGGDTSDNFGMLNDLWEFSPTTGQWTWEGGANTEGASASYGTQGTPGGNPGGREGAARWTDAAGNLWLFGGDSLSDKNSVEFNDLWKYDPTTAQWTWVGGSSTAGNAGSYGTLGTAAASNLPPARSDAITWTDSAGNFWLFGGAQFSASGSISTVLGDLWSYNPGTGQWTWVGGSSTPNATGVYGTEGTAAAGNLPGARMSGNAWVDGSGNFWLFGGLAPQGSATVEYNDLWKYNPSSGDWTWVGGSEGVDASGVYGTPGAPVGSNNPGARATAVSWQDSSGNFWLFGGFGVDQYGDSGDLNDLWQYNPSTGFWTWISGSSYASATGTYGTQGTAGITNTSGGREQAVGWLDSSGNFWLFGGFGIDSFSDQGELNDLWSFALTP